ncbi:MAG: hypothetical protein ACK55Z_16690 [bacterium]
MLHSFYPAHTRNQQHTYKTATGEWQVGHGCQLVCGYGSGCTF